MFEHSVKVPRLYKEAAKIIKQYNENGINVKELIFKNKHPNIKALHALVTETIRKSSKIDFLINKSKLLKNEDRLDRWLASVLITELLWGKKILSGACKPVKTILAYEQILKAHSSDYVEDRSSNTQVLRPRYVRVNTLKLSTDEAVNAFRDEGWIFKRFTDNDDVEGFLEMVTNLGPEEFMIDLHVRNLLIFPPGTEFFKHVAYLSGSIFLQEKASCIPVQVLNPLPGSTVLDMCAAPGNKTTQLAALLNDKGTVYAVDMDQRRTNILEQMVNKSGATCVKIINRDVVTITEKECSNVEYILVDPSCTGSGITNRIKADNEEETVDPERLQKLKGFQIKILKHALRNFPKAERVVYSTCSKYKEENEEVVKEVLQSSRFYKLVPCKKALLGTWLNYGSPEYGDIGSYCLYSKPEKDLTIGFFVAVFERLKEGEENPHLKIQITANDVSKKERRQNRKALKQQQNENESENNDHSNKKRKRSHSENTNSTEDVEHSNDTNRVDRNGQEDNAIVKRKKKNKINSDTKEDVLIDNELSNNTTDNDNNKKRKRKKNKKQDTEMEDVNIVGSLISEGISTTQESNAENKKKKKLHLEQVEDEPSSLNGPTEDSNTKKRKKRKNNETTESRFGDANEEAFDEPANNKESKSDKKKKKSKNQSTEINDNNQIQSDIIVIDCDVKKSKRKRTKSTTEEQNDVAEDDNNHKKAKRKKSKKDKDLEENDMEVSEQHDGNFVYD